MIKIVRTLLLLCTICIVSPSDLYATTLEEGFKSYKEKDFKGAVKHFEKAAEEGNSAAQDILGNAYYNGDMGVEKNLKKANEYWKKAADQEHSGAQANLGLMYFSGIGVEKDIKIAEKYLKKASRAGNLLAMANLGILYIQTGSTFEGLFRLVMAAKAKNPTAKTALLSIGMINIPPLPGESIASQDVVDSLVTKVVIMAKQKINVSCDGEKSRIVDSKILRKPDKVRINDKTYYRMKEEWLMEVCGQKVPVTSEFYTQIKSVNEHKDENGNPITIDNPFEGNDYSH